MCSLTHKCQLGQDLPCCITMELCRFRAVFTASVLLTVLLVKNSLAGKTTYVSILLLDDNNSCRVQLQASLLTSDTCHK